MHEDELQQIGLSEKEAKVYLATLTLGKATAQEVAKKTELKRPTTYFTIDVLMKKGLMSSVYEGKKQFFMAENPERLVDVFEARQDEVRRQGEKLKKLIPDLKQLRPKTDGGPVVKYYTGKEGALSMVKGMLNIRDGETVWAVYDLDIVDALFTEEELSKIRYVRHNKNVNIKTLYTSENKVLSSDERVERIRIDGENYPVHADIAVYEDKIRLADISGDTIGVVVQNKVLAEAMKSILKLAWEAAQRQDDKRRS